MGATNWKKLGNFRPILKRGREVSARPSSLEVDAQAALADLMAVGNEIVELRAILDGIGIDPDLVPWPVNQKRNANKDRLDRRNKYASPIRKGENEHAYALDALNERRYESRKLRVLLQASGVVPGAALAKL